MQVVRAEFIVVKANKAVILQRFGGIFIQIGYFKIYRIVSRLGEDEVLLDLPRCFKCRLVKQSRVYIVIGVTDVKDYTFNTINYDKKLPYSMILSPKNADLNPDRIH